MTSTTGLHHVTAIAGDPQENFEFYTGALGLRLVKKSVNQDAPGTYHLFFADDAGHAGTDLTFFPWPQMGPARAGHGLTNEVALAVPVRTLGYWQERLRRHGLEAPDPVSRFGAATLAFRDPHGMAVALVESAPAAGRDFAPWPASAVPADRQIRGLHAVRLRTRDLASTATFLEQALGFRQRYSEEGWRRYAVGDGESGSFVDVYAVSPEERRGAWGVGAIHHVAFRATDEAHQLAIRRQVERFVQPTDVIDRFWFKSIYFKEPGGALFEVATDGPGFARDEDAAHLGESLVLPPWLEPRRGEIEAGLPALRPPDVRD